jgi:hypothetical protein
MHITERISFTGLISSCLPLKFYVHICKKENKPPVKSKIILQIDHYFVDFL